MFGSWNSVVCAIEDLIQVAGNHRALMILKKVYKALFNCEAFMNWVYKLNLAHMFLLVLEIKFVRGLYLYDEGHDIDANYDLPQPLKETVYIYAVTAVAKTFFDPIGDLECPTLCLTQREGQQNPCSTNGPNMAEHQ